MPDAPVNSEADAYAAAYRQHATTLRSWLVAYGVGGPAVFLTNDKLRDALKASENLKWIGWTFLLGVAIQVPMSFVDKYSDWICYQRCQNPAWPRTYPSQFAAWWVNANTPSILFEFSSMALFAIATVIALTTIF